jgi:hypothetical protein
MAITTPVNEAGIATKRPNAHVDAIPNRVFFLFVVLFISGAIVRSAIATRVDSWTQDEGYHIVAGASYVQR